MATRAEMMSRVARYGELREHRGNFLDITLPGHVRSTMILLGAKGLSNDPTLGGALPPEEHFTLGMQKATTGNGPGLHSHRTVEVFVALSGTWRLYWIDDDGEGETEFNTWDVAAIPGGVWRGLEVTSEGEGLLMGIRGGVDGGGIEWHPSIIAEAAEQGRTLDDEQTLVVRDDD